MALENCNALKVYCRICRVALAANFVLLTLATERKKMVRYNKEDVDLSCNIMFVILIACC
jgi:hypothetical protein